MEMKKDRQFTPANIARWPDQQEIVETWTARQRHFCAEDLSHYRVLADPITEHVFADLGACSHCVDEVTA
jgi:hypothetical protein